MNGSYMTHIDRSDTVAISAPSATSRTGCLKVTSYGGDLYIFPPSDLASAQSFLTSLIERATELREQIAAGFEAQLAAA